MKKSLLLGSIFLLVFSCGVQQVVKAEGTKPIVGSMNFLLEHGKEVLNDLHINFKAHDAANSEGVLATFNLNEKASGDHFDCKLTKNVSNFAFDCDGQIDQKLRTMKGTFDPSSKDGYFFIDVLGERELTCVGNDNNFVCTDKHGKVIDFAKNSKELANTTDRLKIIAAIAGVIAILGTVKAGELIVSGLCKSYYLIKKSLGTTVIEVATSNNMSHQQ